MRSRAMRGGAWALLVVSAVVFAPSCKGGPGIGFFTDDLDFSRAGSVTGTVTDARTGVPLEGAVVATQGQVAFTDAGGRYELGNDLRTGWYDVTVGRAGYQSLTKNVEIGIYTPVDFQLLTEE